MISDESAIDYAENNKIYIPEQYNNENYKYTISGDEITIITNLNCTTSYNTTYCDCIRYNERYNIATQEYQCNRNPNNYIIDNSYISSNVNDSYRITRDYTNNYTIYLLMLLAIVLIATMFKRNSRKI